MHCVRTGLVSLPDEAGVAPQAFLDVSVQAVVRYVGGAAFEPAVAYWPIADIEVV